MMKTIQMTIDEQLLDSVDQTVIQLKTTRSAFIREALADALHRAKISLLEQKQMVGYLANPQKTEEIEEWNSERLWSQE